MVFRDMVNSVKGAVTGGLKPGAEVLVDTGHGPFLRIVQMGASLDVEPQQLILKTGQPPPGPKKRKHLPNCKTMFEIWDREKVEA